MTSIARYKDIIAADHRYLCWQGDSVITQEGPSKIFRHETNNAVIGISGGISDYVVWRAIDADLSQLLLDIDKYPEELPKISNLRNLFDDKSDNGILKKSTSGIPHIMICTKEWTVCISTTDNDIRLFVYSADMPVCIGTGSDFFSMHINTINNKDDFIAAMSSAAMGDQLTGNKITVTQLTWGKT